MWTLAFFFILYRQFSLGGIIWKQASLTENATQRSLFISRRIQKSFHMALCYWKCILQIDSSTKSRGFLQKYFSPQYLSGCSHPQTGKSSIDCKQHTGVCITIDKCIKSTKTYGYSQADKNTKLIPGVPQPNKV